MQPERLGLREIGGISVVAKASAARDFFRSFLFFLLDEKEPKNQENLMLSVHNPTHARQIFGPPHVKMLSHFSVAVTVLPGFADDVYPLTNIS